MKFGSEPFREKNLDFRGSTSNKKRVFITSATGLLFVLAACLAEAAGIVMINQNNNNKARER